MSAEPNAQLTQAALSMAIQQRRPCPGLLHHSDRGCRYTAGSYLEELAKQGMSLSRKGDCWDNAPMESFFSTLKLELGDTFSSREQARGQVFEYIEVFYNRQRKHSSLGYLSPASYEEQLEATA